MSKTIADVKAIADVEIELAKLSEYHQLCKVSFVYGFLLGRGCSDEFACYESDKYAE